MRLRDGRSNKVKKAHVAIRLSRNRHLPNRSFKSCPSIARGVITKTLKIEFWIFRWSGNSRLTRRASIQGGLDRNFHRAVAWGVFGCEAGAERRAGRWFDWNEPLRMAHSAARKFPLEARDSLRAARHRATCMTHRTQTMRVAKARRLTAAINLILISTPDPSIGRFSFAAHLRDIVPSPHCIVSIGEE
jgi:hypothetical protein